MKEDDTNISIRTTKRFAAWFRLRADQENLTASKLGFALLQRWVTNGSPMVTEGMRKSPLLWDPEIDWEKLEAKQPDSLAPLPARRR